MSRIPSLFLTLTSYYYYHTQIPYQEKTGRDGRVTLAKQLNHDTLQSPNFKLDCPKEASILQEKTPMWILHDSVSANELSYLQADCNRSGRQNHKRQILKRPASEGGGGIWRR